MKFNKNIFKIAVFTLTIFFAGFTTSQCFAQNNSTELSNFQYLRKFNQLFEFVHQNYVDEKEAKKLYEGALKGLMESFEDPYTSYLDHETIRDLSDTTSGNFGGVGLSISKAFESKPGKPAYLEVASPIEDSPGAKAGILSGDYITHINDEPTEPMTMQQVLDKLRGEVGTSVNVTILRGKNLTFSVNLVRALIEVPTVKYTMIEKTGYLRIIQFTPDTPERVQEALDDFKSKNYKNLIIDLRDNPGGLISSVADVADKFIDEGPIVSTKSRIPEQNSVFNANKSSTVVKNIPIVVLINQGSASASEILSGALKDNHLAYLVGQRTYGKGSVQQVIPLGDDEAIKMTIARYYTPSDSNIDKIGIPPDLEIKYPTLTEEEEKAYSDLMNSNKIDELIEKNPKMTESEIKFNAEELKKTYNLDSRLLRRLIRMQIWRYEPSHIYDLDYDIQLNKALDILKNENFTELVHSTKTLKELQEEAKLQEEKTEKSNSDKVEEK